MSTTRLSFATWQGDIEIKTQLVDSECLADYVDRTKFVEDGAQPGWFNALDLEVPVLWFVAHQHVADTTTDKQCPAARVADGY